MCTLVATGVILRSLGCNTHTPSVWEFFHHEPDYFSDSSRQLVKSHADKAVERLLINLHMELRDREESTFQEVFLLTYKEALNGPEPSPLTALITKSTCNVNYVAVERAKYAPFMDSICDVHLVDIYVYIRTLKSPKRVIT
jgi:hypothetical protein